MHMHRDKYCWLRAPPYGGLKCTPNGQDLFQQHHGQPKMPDHIQLAKDWVVLAWAMGAKVQETNDNPFRNTPPELGATVQLQRTGATADSFCIQYEVTSVEVSASSRRHDRPSNYFGAVGAAVDEANTIPIDARTLVVGGKLLAFLSARLPNLKPVPDLAQLARWALQLGTHLRGSAGDGSSTDGEEEDDGSTDEEDEDDEDDETSSSSSEEESPNAVNRLVLHVRKRKRK